MLCACSYTDIQLLLFFSLMGSHLNHKIVASSSVVLNLFQIGRNCNIIFSWNSFWGGIIWYCGSESWIRKYYTKWWCLRKLCFPTSSPFILFYGIPVSSLYLPGDLGLILLIETTRYCTNRSNNSLLTAAMLVQLLLKYQRFSQYLLCLVLR